MARVDLPEHYAVRQMRQNVRDSLMSHGEEAVLIHMFHVNEVSETQPRCAYCMTNPVYEQGNKIDCDRCYGTTFDGGVMYAYRAWALFTDAQDQESFSKRGVWHPVARSVHTEWRPDLWKRDYIVRVGHWGPGHTILDLDGIYVLRDVVNESMRTGAQRGQTTLDLISQRADLSLISEDMPIYKYPLVGQKFARMDGLIR